MSSKRKSAVENTCVREHLKRTKPGNSGKVKPAKTAFSVQGLPSGFFSTDIQQENCSTIVINGQRLDLRKIPIIDDQQQMLNNIVSNNETEDIEDGRSDEREDENVDGENEHHDNNNYQNNNENEEFRAPHNNQNETQSLLDFEQLDHDIDHCCLSCREILLMLLKKVDQLLLIMKNGPQKNNNNNNPQNEQIAGTFDQLQMLPIKEVEQLLLFDQNLVNPLHRQMRSQFEAKMVAVGGDTFDKAIKRILSVIMTDELAGKCTWIIRKAGKTKISNCNFPKIISVYITKKYSITDEIVKKRIQLWLQKYGDRIKLKEEQARKDEEHRQKEIEEERRLFNQA
ncbi:uncharacterized protein [Temnothorax longispinosus]|uniref:uncharacterized protein n=1 Tax=Temnothorax longispinosus TaxID=300112 RepID=UPI003A9A5B01